MSEARKVPVFFYGSFIDRDVLARGGLVPERVTVARLDGFGIARRPLATLDRSDRHAVYGILTGATHEELERLYGQAWVRAYKPEPVLVTTAEGALHPALCYIAPGRTADPPMERYLDHILRPARELGFPAWYIERLERLKP